MTLENGRPADESGRLAREIRCYDFLDGLGVDYQRVDHAPAMTMEDCAEVDRALGATVCKNLFLCNRQQTDFYLLLLPGDKVFKTKDLSAQIGSARLSFASGEQMETLLGVTPGSCTVFGLLFDEAKRVRLLIDRDLLDGDRIGAHPCINTSTLRFRTADLFEKILPALGHAPTFVTL